MKISAPYIAGDQEVLPWDDDSISTPSAARPAVGEFFERCTLEVTGAVRHQLDATADVCPDMSQPGHRYIECKGLRWGGQAIVFAHRLARDRQLIDETGGTLTYCFWTHRAAATQCTSRRELWGVLSQAIQSVYVIPFELIERTCRGMRPTLRIERRGEDLRGFRIPWRTVQRMAGARREWLSPPISVGGHVVPPVSFIGATGLLLPPLTTDERFAAHEMARELGARGLSVVLTPAPMARHAGHCVRTVAERNPAWYRALGAAYPKERGAGRWRAWGKQVGKVRRRSLPDSTITRPRVLTGLRRLADGIAPTYQMDFRLLPYVKAMAANWEAYGD